MRFLTEHLTSVNETYWQHFGHAAKFAFTLLVASLACLVHAFFPFLLVKTGSKMINKLHAGMVANRSGLSAKQSMQTKEVAGNTGLN